jgi:hypothetical protein
LRTRTRGVGLHSFFLNLIVQNMSARKRRHNRQARGGATDDEQYDDDDGDVDALGNRLFGHAHPDTNGDDHKQSRGVARRDSAPADGVCVRVRAPLRVMSVRDMSQVI